MDKNKLVNKKDTLFNSEFELLYKCHHNAKGTTLPSAPACHMPH